MDQLPQELVDEISSHLPKQDLKNVLTLTSKFRFAAERYSGAFTEFTINEHNSQTFLALFSGHRLLYLREVKFRPIFPEYIWDSEEPEKTCRENEEQLRERDESFTRQIKFLFTTLKSVEKQAEEKRASGNYRLKIRSGDRCIDSGIDCWHPRYVSWRVHLLNPAELPQIASVRSLEIRNNDVEYEFKLDLRIIIDLATKLPNLEFLGCQTGGHEWYQTMAEEEPGKHYEHDWEGPRRDSRHDFARAVSSCSAQLPTSLKRASLDFLNPLDRAFDINHWMGLPDLVSPAPQDPFSSSLRIMSNNLRQLQLRAVVDESLFWPNKDAAFFGPNLEILEVLFHIARPDGKWYFHGPGGEGHHAVGFEVTDKSYPPFETSELDMEMDILHEEWPRWSENSNNFEFRITPHQSNLRPLLEGFAKAAARMRSLKEATIWSVLNWSIPDEFDIKFGESDRYTGAGWGIVYTAPGLYPKSGSSRRLDWLTEQWRPDPELHDLFQRIGRDKHGEELEEFWAKGDCSRPALREQFDDFMFFHDPGYIPLSR